MVQVIDAYAHAFPKSLRTTLQDAHDPDGMRLMEAPRFWDVEHRIADMDEFGVDKQVIMQGRGSVWNGLSREEALPLVREANDAMAEMAAEKPDRLIPAGTLPFITGEYVDEFERCVEDLGMVGIQIPSNIRGRPLDDEAFKPFLEKAVALDAPIWIHPASHNYYDWTDQYAVHKVFGWLFDTTLAQARLVYSGRMEELPELDIITHHMGGMVPYFEERIKDFYAAYADETWPQLSKPVEEYFKMFYADTVLNGATAPIHCGREFYGTDNLVFGTDYPFGPEEGRKWMREIPKSVDALDLPADEREHVYQENIANLLA